jgi:hypothetical protein
MSLQRIKITISALWIVGALVTILVAGASITATLGIITLGVLPPVALFLLWTDPAPTMTQRINEALR